MNSLIKKFSYILNKKQKIRIVVISIMMIIGGFLETIGVGLILPLISAITSSDFIEKNKYAHYFCEILNIHTKQSFILFVIVILIVIYILKNVYLFIEYSIQARFICHNRFGVQKKIVKAYMQKPYEFFLKAQSGEIVRIVTSDTTNTFQLLSIMLSFFTEAIVSIALIITIILTDPLMAIMLAFILGGLMGIIGVVIKPILKKAGVQYQKSVSEMNKWLLQSITGIKEVKIAQKEDYFIEQFAQFGKIEIEAEKKNIVLGTIPRLAIEALGISAMLIIIAVLMMSGREINSMLPQLTVFAMAAVRLLPSVNRMSSALNTMSYYEPALDKMLEHLSNTNEDEKCKSKRPLLNKKNTLNELVELRNITFSYGCIGEAVLENANMSIPVGTAIGIVGASGAGKTTAVDIMLGLLKPQEGKVLADGVDIQTVYHAWLSHIGYIPQMIFMLDDSIRGNVAFGIETEEIDDQAVWKALEEAQLAEFVHSLPDGLDTQIGERGIRLSGGQRQRIGIARALYSDPELLIFDEATSALDNETESAIMESINALHGKKTMVIIAHRLTTIQGCDMVYRVENGKIERER